MADAEKDLALEVGQEFNTFADFENLLTERKKKYAEGWAIGSGGRTVKQANKKLNDVSLHFKEEFKYSYVHIKCIHGGKFRSRGFSRKNRRSHQIGCPAHITLSAKRKLDKMVITHMNLEHNHELFQESRQYYHTKQMKNPKDVEIHNKILRKLKTKEFKNGATPPGHIQNYSSFLSKMAYRLVLEQMEKLFQCKDYRFVDGHIHLLKDEGETETVIDLTNGQCSCLFYLNHQLPCWHLMARNLSRGKPLVEKSTVPKKYLKRRYSFMKNMFDDVPAADTIYEREDGGELSSVEKLQAVTQLWDEFASTMVNCGQTSFEVRCKVLRFVMESWNIGRDIPYGMVIEDTKNVTAIVNDTTADDIIEEEVIDGWVDTPSFEPDNTIVISHGAQVPSTTSATPVLRSLLTGNVINIDVSDNASGSGTNVFRTVKVETANPKKPESDHTYTEDLSSPTLSNAPISDVSCLRERKCVDVKYNIEVRGQDTIMSGDRIIEMASQSQTGRLGIQCNICHSVKGKEGEWLEWIECVCCSTWLHKTCLFEECRKVTRLCACSSVSG